MHKNIMKANDIPCERRSSRLLVGVAILLVAAAGGMAYASIPAPDGTIYACRHKVSGDLRVIDSTDACNNSEVPLNWSQTGKDGTPGPPGPSDAYSASTSHAPVGGSDTTLVSVAVPAGNYTVAAKTHLYNTAENSFALCELRAAGVVIDESTNRLIAPANDQVVPFLGVASLAEGGTIALVCNGNGVSTVESEESTIVATKVGTLH